jgi:hypothetical protein
MTSSGKPIRPLQKQANNRATVASSGLESEAVQRVGHQGSRHKATMAALALLGNDLEGTTGKLVEKAKAGEPWAIKLVMDKLVPNAKDAPVTFKAPRLRAAGDLQAALSAILRAVSRGKITPDEAHRPSPLS